MGNRKYSKEFKLEALDLAEQVGGAQTERSLGVPANMVYRWHQEQKQSGERCPNGYKV